MTQPRKVAAESIARRVAQEQSCRLGQLVGYSVRFEDVTSPETRIKYLTDGMMFREATNDEILSKYSIIILDEAHERSVNTDILFGITRRAQHLRKIRNLPPFKLLIMSATLDVEKVAEYFQAPVIIFDGREHPVKLFHSLKTYENYAFTALSTAFRIHRDSPAK